LKDDVTIIFLLGVSFMKVVYIGSLEANLKGRTKKIVRVWTLAKLKKAQQTNCYRKGRRQLGKGGRRELLPVQSYQDISFGCLFA
jgi:hypothetical protein